MKIDFFADSIECIDRLAPFYKEKELEGTAGRFYVPPDINLMVHLAGLNIPSMPLSGQDYGTMRAIVASLEDGDK